MSAYLKNLHLVTCLARKGIEATIEQANILRRAELTLSRWGERECGDGGGRYVFRDDETGKTFEEWEGIGGKRVQRSCPDLETGALKRVADVCRELGAFFYHQTDPRGVTVYVGKVKLDCQNYDRDGVACWVKS